MVDHGALAISGRHASPFFNGKNARVELREKRADPREEIAERGMNPSKKRPNHIDDGRQNDDDQPDNDQAGGAFVGFSPSSSSSPSAAAHETVS